MLDVDPTVALIKATVQIDQPINETRRMVGTGFLVSVPKPGGGTEVVLVTAAHVFEKMPAPQVRLGWRIKGAKGTWVYTPEGLNIRSDSGPLWYQHPTQDIAVMPVELPDGLSQAAIPEDWLASDAGFIAEHIEPGDEMMTLGYPHGLSANVAGFPILRAGRLASYPLMPSSAYPTFLIDLTAVPGNSGGPVFLTADGTRPHVLVTGVLIKQVEDDNQRLELGVVTDAVFVRETIDLMLKAQMSGQGPGVHLTIPTAPAPLRTPADSHDMTGTDQSDTAAHYLMKPG
ncbi:serine protease [Asticcacaulis sp. EMRT-3]|uniref:S1 family peptidase n=1 Tax=Asticcacaulis sp. EMRT-3 TaxID=3040349 RepID=UPI0024AF522B|nr:serine protease [Asticcacaulis sp. EMRT-3]MDI7774628.1 serine protease [Asticcacaulis sp. EMRT-3]